LTYYFMILKITKFLLKLFFSNIKLNFKLI
jgi:hypothetical protein